MYLGSNISFMSESLHHEIVFQEVRKSLCMETKGVQHAIKGIQLTGFDEKHLVNLLTLYAEDIAPVSKDHIPTTDDIRKWPQLEGIVLQEVDAEIGLLLGNNVPHVYSPREVVTVH